MAKVHLDTDLGGDLDDLCALALLSKWPEIEITGITTVTDDKGKRAGFTKYALKLVGRDDIPVKAGADISLGCYRIKCGYQDERYWPKSTQRIENTIDEALELLKKSIDNNAIIIGIGPYTNFYLLDRKYPGILRKANLFLMGGYIYPPREGYPQWKQNYDFNIQVDVTSAKHVLENSQPTLIPLTVTIETFLRRAYLGRLRQSDELNKLLAQQAEVFAMDEKNEEKYGKTCPKLPNDIINFLHDPLAVAIALGWNDSVEFKELPLTFTIKDTWLHETIDPSSDGTYRIVTKIDGEKFSNYWLSQLTTKSNSDIGDKRKLVKAGYNQCARNYADNRDLFKNQKYLEDLAKNLTIGAEILDIGCGSGVPIDKFLLEKGFKVTGIDISEEMIKLAKENLPSGSFSVKDMAEIDFPANSFDAVVSFYAIFHIPREEHLSLLKKLHSLLKTNGHLLITMGSSNWEGTEDDFHGAKMFWSHYDRDKNVELVKQAGFQIIYDTVDTSGGEKHLAILAKKQRSIT